MRFAGPAINVEPPRALAACQGLRVRQQDAMTGDPDACHDNAPGLRITSIPGRGREVVWLGLSAGISCSVLSWQSNSSSTDPTPGERYADKDDYRTYGEVQPMASARTARPSRTATIGRR